MSTLVEKLEVLAKDLDQGLLAGYAERVRAIARALLADHAKEGEGLPRLPDAYISGGAPPDMPATITTKTESVADWEVRQHMGHEVRSPAPAAPDALRDTFVAGAVAGGSMARQLSRTDTWQEWLNGEIERRYPKAALAPRGEGGNCICESQLGEKGEHFPMCPNYSKPAPAAPDALREEVIALTKWRDIWQGEIGNDDDWFIQGIEYASGKILKILSGDSGQRELLESARHALRSYENGNRATGLARRVADRIDAFFAPRKEDEG